MMRLLIFLLLTIFINNNAIGRNSGETEITTEDGIEVFQNDFQIIALSRKKVKINHNQNIHWKENPMEYQITEREVSANDNIDIYLAPGGGFAIEIIAK